MQPRVFVEKGKDPRVRLKGFGLFIYLFIYFIIFGSGYQPGSNIRTLVLFDSNPVFPSSLLGHVCLPHSYSTDPYFLWAPDVGLSVGQGMSTVHICCEVVNDPNRYIKSNYEFKRLTLNLENIEI